MYNISSRLNLEAVVKTALFVSMVLFFIHVFVNAYFIAPSSHIFNRELNPFVIDDQVNSVVSANTSRLLFPTKVRINSLIEEYTGNWRIGPHWQHIPPLFAYVPLPFFLVDGKVSIEMYRLAFALTSMATGILLIVSVAIFTRSLTVALAAMVASIVWAYSPMTYGLVSGAVFGVSDILLAFTVVASLSATCWYFSKPRRLRVCISFLKLGIITFVVTLPVLTKSFLGAIPLLTFIFIVAHDQKKITLRIIILFALILFVLSLYYGSLFVASPETFLIEIKVPFNHFENYESWLRPWYFYVTDYLPTTYFKEYWTFFVVTLPLAIGMLASNKLKKKVALILKIVFGWFVWNLVAVSMVASKSPNFAYQSYLLILFLIVFTLFWMLLRIYPVLAFSKFYQSFVLGSVITVLTVSILLYVSWQNIILTNNAINKFKEGRNSEYGYYSTSEKYYELGLYAQERGAGLNDIFIVKPMGEEPLLVYSILFLTGSETRLVSELINSKLSSSQLSLKYDRLHVIVPRGGQLIEAPYSFSNVQATKSFQLVTYDLRTIDKKIDLNSLISAI